ncbi:MAG: Rod shape-determining protein RodA, partial [Microgenomates group bacterium GW2011_GWD1_33_9]
MKFDWLLVLPIFLLLIFSFFILNSISPSIFPAYYWYIGLGVLAFLFFSLFDFEIVSAFSNYFYVISIVLLIATLIIGQVTRGTVRWIPIGSLSFQPSEMVRPFLLIFFADYITQKKLHLKRLVKIIALMGFPLVLILIQPSLGVTALTAIGFLGLFLASEIDKKYFFFLGLIAVIVIPIIFSILAPYQKNRITAFLDPSKDPQGAGYNAIQAVIAIGSGQWIGRGLGLGTQSHLRFLPEYYTDFMFATLVEELGFFGGAILLFLYTLLLWNIIRPLITNTIVGRLPVIYTIGVFTMLLTQIAINSGMNMGILPITGITLPLVSYGG